MDQADRLSQRGIQVTAQRLAVLRAVAGQPHITADGVADVVRAEIGAISLQSVYDALGILVAEGAQFIVSGEWWVSFFPGAVLMLAVFTFNLLGDALRDIFDPRRRT